LLLEPPDLAAEAVDLTLERSESLVRCAAHTVALEPRRQGTPELRVEDHRDQRDQQGQNDDESPHDDVKLRSSRHRRQGGHSPALATPCSAVGALHPMGTAAVSSSTSIRSATAPRRSRPKRTRN